MAIILVLIFVSVVGILIFAFLLSMNFTKSINDFKFSLQNEMGLLKTHLQDHLQNSSQVMQNSHSEVSTRLDNAARVVADVREKLGKLEESSRNIYEIGKDISGLQELLRSPKIRGGMGEFFLGDILSQIMPKEFYRLQYEFKSKDRVDAVIKVGKRLVSIDAKFPLENFKKFIEAKTDAEKKILRKQFISDVKNHIKAISEKYILPDELTYDFALMYIPAENVYYETIINDKEFEGVSLFGYSVDKKVIPVSPNSLYAYLQVIILGLRGMQVERSAEAIINTISRLRIDLRRFSEDFMKIGKHIKDSRASFDNAEKQFEKINEKLTSIEISQPAGTLPQSVSTTKTEEFSPEKEELGEKI